MKKIKKLLVLFILIMLITSISLAKTKINLTSDKEILVKDEEISIKIQMNEIEIAAGTLQIYFDSSKLQYIKGPDSSNYSNNRIIYTWVSNTGKNERNIETEEFKFKVLQEENTNITVFGELYNEQGEKVEIDDGNIELKVKKQENEIKQERENLEQVRNR